MVSLRRHFVPNPVFIHSTRNRPKCDRTLSVHTRYDAEGNRTVRTNTTTGATTRYEWDHRNRLVRVTEHADADPETPSSKTVEYTYDYQNRWIKKSVDQDGDGQGWQTGGKASIVLYRGAPLKRGETAPWWRRALPGAIELGVQGTIEEGKGVGIFSGGTYTH